MNRTERQILPAEGKLGVLLVGLGAVSSTFVAGLGHLRGEEMITHLGLEYYD